jgi:membrane-associated phospholipid phosphatase
VTAAFRGLIISACLAPGLLSGTSAFADDLSARALLEDTKLYFTAPFHWEQDNWVQFGDALLAIGIAHEFDDNVRSHFVNGSHAVAGGTDPNNLAEAAPAMAIIVGTWAAALFTQDHAGYTEGASMLEAAGLSAISAALFKQAFGRERPNATASVDSWFEGGESFPSGHTTFAFAVGTVLAESGNDDYRWLRRGLGYGIGAATAYFRMRDNVHWLSDTVAGAALGVTTAEFVMGRREPGNSHVSFEVSPAPGGLVVSFSAPLH